jgi:hypothetical protein
MVDRKDLERVSRELAAKGLLLEAGWVALGLRHPSEVQLSRMRLVFFAGASHLLDVLMAPDSESSIDTSERLRLIGEEFRRLFDELTPNSLRIELLRYRIAQQRMRCAEGAGASIRARRRHTTNCSTKLPHHKKA